MKRKGLTIKINLTNRWLYTLIILGVLIAVGVGVYAFGTTNPSAFGHSVSELDFTGGLTVPSGDVKITSGKLCFGNSCKNVWPAPAIECPKASNQLFIDVNEDEDIYPGFTNSGAAETCTPGQYTNNPYTCLASESRTCMDKSYSNSKGRTVTCKKRSKAYCQQEP